MGKRRNDGAQESKEEYEARQYREEMEGGNGGGDNNGNGNGFSRASEAEMKKRRIVRVSSHNKWKKRGIGSGSGTGSAGPIAAPFTPSGTSASASTTTNPFARTVLTPSSKGITSNTNSDASKPNPFAKISFASSTPSGNSSASSGSGGGGGFQFQAPATKRSRPSETTPPMNLLPKSTKSTTSSALRNASTLNTTSSSIPPPVQNKSKDNLHIPMLESTKLNIAMLRMAQMEYQANPLSDWSVWLKNYNRQIPALLEKEAAERVQTGAPGTTTGTTTTGTATTTTSSATTSSSGLFTFGKSAANTTTTASTSSFATKITSAPTSTPASTSASTSSTQPKTTNGLVELDKPEEVAKIVDADTEELYECNAKHRKYISKDEEWKMFSAGKLRVTRNISQNFYQLVIRDVNVGSVKFNIRVVKGMTIHEPIKKNRKGLLYFVAVQDAEEGPENFGLTTKEEDIDGLYEVLKKITG